MKKLICGCLLAAFSSAALGCVNEETVTPILPAAGDSNTGGASGGGTVMSGGSEGSGGSATGGAPGGGSNTGGAVFDAGMDASVETFEDAGCGSELLPLPVDPGLRGPWKVGVRTVTIGRLTAEVVYPAKPGSTTGMEVATFNLRDWLPPEEQSKVPDDATPDVTAIDGDLYRDVPIDDAHGPYPLIIMIHGTSSMRIAAGSTLAHWASRGFIAIGADYPGLKLADKLNEVPLCGRPQSGVQDIPGDVKLQMDAMKNPTGELAFLAGHVDDGRAAIAGHSQGGCVAAMLPAMFDNVQVVIAQSASTTISDTAGLKSYMYISGAQDQVIPFDENAPPTLGNIVCAANPLPATTSKAGYQASANPPEAIKRLVGVMGGGHLLPTDLCQTNQYGRNAIEEAKKDMVCGIDNAVFIGLPALFDCGTIDWIEGLRAVNYATTAQLEETLHCVDHTASFAEMQTRYPEITVFEEQP